MTMHAAQTLAYSAQYRASIAPFDGGWALFCRGLGICARLKIREQGDKDHGGRFGNLHWPSIMAKVVPVNSGHADIEKDQFEGVLFKGFEG